MDIKDSNIAIIHDWFLNNSLGGAEKVTFLLDKFLCDKYSKPDIFSLTSNLKFLEDHILKGRTINNSFIQSLPFGKSNVQNYLPLLPFAIEQIDLRKYNFIFSSSHAFAKGVITCPDQLHVSYVHTPMRYAWDQMQTYLEQITHAKSTLKIPIRYILYKLREWDYLSAQRVDYLISNSNFTAKRIKKYWGLDSKVIHPPVEIERFDYKKNRGEFYLSVNRLVPNKRIDLLVKSFNKLGLPLIIIGDGPERFKLEKLAKSNIKFLGKKSNFIVSDYMNRCRAFVYAGLEDFGIAPIEAMAAGAPVIAYGRGGILDTVNCISNKNNKIPNGILFKKQTVEDIFDSVLWFEDKKIWKKFNAQTLNDYAQKFNSNNFISKIESFLQKVWDDFHQNNIVY
tara:strand:- start:3156 stop:4340 length:1185 start_codon:yes stop_codon:yes gene_type:complete